jgi:DNA-binding response OmpR family regulator
VDLVKPVEPAELVAVVVSLIGRAAGQRAPSGDADR